MTVDSSDIQIVTEFTPNPSSLKFVVNRILLEDGSAFFSNPSEAQGVSLAEHLLNIPMVKEVLLGRDFVTVTRKPEIETWAAIIPTVTKILKDYLAAGHKVVLSKIEKKAGPPEGEIEKKIQQILDQQIRPAVARDGGDIVFHDYKNGIVKLHLQGACSSCPSSIATLKAGVERLLKEHIPEIKEVIQV